MRHRTTTVVVSLAALLLCAGPALAGHERDEVSFTHQEALSGAGVVQVENLLGSVVIEGGGDEGVVSFEVRVIAEAETADEAKALAETIRLERRDSPDGLDMHVVWPVDRLTAFRPPKEGSMLTKWITPLMRKKTVAAVYDDRAVQLGPSKGATVLTVELTVTVPHDATTSVRQYMGTVEADLIRGVLEIENVEGHVSIGRIYGGVSARSAGGNLEVLTAKGERVHLQSATGDLTVVDIAVDEMHLQTGSGRVEGRAIQVARMTVRSDTGEVDLDELESKSFEVATSSGDIDLDTMLQRTKEASIQSASGDVVLRLGRIAPFDLDARTETGSVKAQGEAFKIEQEDKTAARVQRGRGGADLDVSTTSGEVVLKTK